MNILSSTNAKKLLFPGAVLMATALFFYQLTFTRGVPFYFDLYFYIYPNVQWMSQSLAGGHWAFWNPYLKGGVPFLADPGVGFYYPLHLIFLLFSFPIALKIFLLIHFAIGFGGCYYCARQYGLSQRASLLSATAFAFSGYLISMANTFKLRGLVWIPLFFGLARRSREKKSLPTLAGAVLAMVILTGHLYGAYWMGLFFGLEILWEWKKGRRPQIGFLSWIVFVGLGLSACQWVPSVAMLPSSSRAKGLDKWSKKQWHLPPCRLAELAIPGVYGFESPAKVYLKKQEKDWIPSLYLGLSALLLALMAMGKIPFFRQGFWLIMVVASALLALGRYTPLWSLAQGVIPLVNRLRYPEKMVFWFTFGMAMLAGMGYDRFFSKGEITKRDVLWLILAMAGGFLLFPHGENPSLSALFPWIRALLVGVVFSLLFGFRKVWAGTGILLIGFLWADLQGINSREIPLTTPSIYATMPRVLDSLPPLGMGQGRIGQWRSTIFVPASKSLNSLIEAKRENLEGNAPMIYGYEAIVGITPATLWRYNVFFRQFYKKPEIFFDLLQVQYLMGPLHPAPWMEGRYQKFSLSWPKMQWYKAKPTLSRVRLYYDITRALDFSQALILAKKNDLRHSLIVEDPAEGRQITVPAKGDRAEIISYSNHRVVVNVTTSGPAYLVLLDGFSPGWEVRDEKGKSLAIRPGNLLFRAVSLTGGSHTLTFQYTPPGWWWAWLVVGLVLVTIVVIHRRSFFSIFSKKL